MSYGRWMSKHNWSHGCGKKEHAQKKGGWGRTGSRKKGRLGGGSHLVFLPGAARLGMERDRDAFYVTLLEEKGEGTTSKRIKTKALFRHD